MDFIAVMHTYFQAEKQLGWLMSVVGAALLLAAFWVYYTQVGSFALSLTITLLIGGMGLGGGGAALAVRTGAQVAAIEADYRADPAGLAARELPRMERVNANWPRVKSAWTAAILVSLVLLMGVKRDWSAGLGLGLLLLATFLFFVDVFAERRARPYTTALNNLPGNGRLAP